MLRLTASQLREMARIYIAAFHRGALRFVTFDEAIERTRELFDKADRREMERGILQT